MQSVTTSSSSDSERLKRQKLGGVEDSLKEPLLVMLPPPPPLTTISTTTPVPPPVHVHVATPGIPAVISNGSTAPQPVASPSGEPMKRKQVDNPFIVSKIQKLAIEKKQTLLSKLVAFREHELRELVFLEGAGNLLDYDETSPSLNAALEKYHETHKLVSDAELLQTRSSLLRVQLRGHHSNVTNQATSSLELNNTSLFSHSQNGTTHEDIVAKASKDAEVLKRVSELQKEGLWSAKRIPKIPEPPRHKVHWDYLLAEMVWLANDFKEERKWKMALARKASKHIAKYHEAIRTKEERQAKEEEARLRKMAKNVAMEIKRFWAQIDKLITYKNQMKQEALKKKALGEQLDQLVVQTEHYSKLLAQDLSSAKSEVPQESIEEHSTNGMEVKVEDESLKNFMERSYEKDAIEDQEFAPQREETDDETTIDQEEQEPTDKDTDEISVLKKESEMPIEDILGQYQFDEEDDEEEQEDEHEIDADKSSKEIMSEAADAAKEAQPTGFTLSTTKVKTKIPFLLRGSLREYQHIGLDWLVTMYEKKLNGILADEMGLGKTIMTISLLAHLACEKGIWGPHLIVVPTSTMLNWELELKRWCPAFKVLTYFGSLKERKLKRQGWSKPNSFHVCITSYKLVLQDHAAFRRKKWKYLILDEAQHIKNFKSQRWQTLLNFNTSRRLLLTGTPLQNSLMELWSLMHFLMPHIFQSHKEFKDWFSNPVHSMIEGEQQINEDLINRLHSVLRPFILRRLKSEVEKQLPPKIEHIVRCRLSKRQRLLYEEFMSAASTKNTLASGNFLGIVNVLMQLRKVTNHPDLFESRPIISPFDQERLWLYSSSLATRAMEKTFFDLDLDTLNLSFTSNDLKMTSYQAQRTLELRAQKPLIVELASSAPDNSTTLTPLNAYKLKREEAHVAAKRASLVHLDYLNEYRCSARPLYGSNLITLLTVHQPTDVHQLAKDPKQYLNYSNRLQDLILLPEQRMEQMRPIITHFVCIIPSARAPAPRLHCSHPNPSIVLTEARQEDHLLTELSATTTIFRPSFVRSQLYFPDKRLVQYDCGKLQELSKLLRKLKAEGHRALIFTQMTRMLDILEIFLNIYGYTYLRLDGATKVERRQMAMERFNKDPRIFLFILSTRSGGIGINLVGADTVIFYDSDWNPAMDAQAQDRCHRIGQTREVHIYRLISQHTVEENILKKANQKRHLDEVVIANGSFTTDFFKRVNIRELIDGGEFGKEALKSQKPVTEQDWIKAVSSVEEETDVLAMKEAQKEQVAETEAYEKEFVEESKEEIKSGEKEADDALDFEFESELTPIQRYALKFLEVSGSKDTFKDPPQFLQNPPKEDSKKESIPETPAEAVEKVDVEEALFYEIPGGVSIDAMKGQLLNEIPNIVLYGPPNPESEELYIPPLDDLDYLGVYPYYSPSLSDPKKRKEKKQHPKSLQGSENSIPFESASLVPEDEELSNDKLANKDKSSLDVTDISTSEEVEPNGLGPLKSVKKEKRDKKVNKKEKKLKHEEHKQKTSEKKDKTKRKVKADTNSKPKKPLKKTEEDFFFWTPADDSAITEAKAKFGSNWELIADIVNSLPRPVSKRCSRRQCFEHWKNALQTKEEPSEGSKDTVYAPHQFAILDIIKKTVQKKKQIPGDTMMASIPTHASHAQAAMVVKSRNPIEIASNALLKIQRIPKELPNAGGTLNQSLDTKLSSLTSTQNAAPQPKAPLVQAPAPLVPARSTITVVPKSSTTQFLIPPVSGPAQPELARAKPFPTSTPPMKPLKGASPQGTGATMILNPNNGNQTSRLALAHINQVVASGVQQPKPLMPTASTTSPAIINVVPSVLPIAPQPPQSPATRSKKSPKKQSKF